jgi:hypothetical protein
MTDTLHERCRIAAEEALPCSHTSHTCEKGNHFMPCHGALRYAVAAAMEKLVREERDRALEDAADQVICDDDVGNEIYERIRALKGAGR